MPLLAPVWKKAPAAGLPLLMEQDWRWWLREEETGNLNLNQSSGAAQVRAESACDTGQARALMKLPLVCLGSLKGSS